MKTATVLAPRLSVVFRRLLRDGSFPGLWKQADVTPIPKGSPSSLVSDYRPISITPVLSKVFEKVISSRLQRYSEEGSFLPPSQYAYRKGLGTCDALLHISQVGQSALERGSEVLLVQLDFSAAFDMVNHLGLLYRLQLVGVGGRFLRVLQQFLCGRSQRVVLGGESSNSVPVTSGVPQGSVLGPLLFLLYTSELTEIVDNVFVTYADDSTPLAVVPSARDRPRVVGSINDDLARISDWCGRWDMRLNASKTKSMVISRSRALVPGFPDLLLGGSRLDMVSTLKILGVVFDSKLTFESHLREVATSASQRLGILRKTWGVFRDTEIVKRCFWSFLLPVLEYCAPVWSSAADCHLALLDRVVRNVNFLCSGSIKCDLEHRRHVSSLCMFYKIRQNCTHPLNEWMPDQYVAGRLTRHAVSAHKYSVVIDRARTSQFMRCFIPRCSRVWNGLSCSVFEGDGLDSFKCKVNRFLLDR